MGQRIRESNRRPHGLAPAQIFDWHGWSLHEITGCWEWSGRHDRRGYGLAGSRPLWGEADIFAHRLSYEVNVGAIPEGMFVRHVCDNPPCVNPEHLTLGSKHDNSMDMAQRGRQRHQGRTRCDRGHDLTLPGSIYVQVMRKSAGRRVPINRCALCYAAARATARANRAKRDRQSPPKEVQ